MRGKRAKKRIIVPDAVYKSKIVTRMINVVMLDGKKSLAEGIVYGAIDRLAEDKKEALRIFEEAIKKIMPQQEMLLEQNQVNLWRTTFTKKLKMPTKGLGMQLRKETIPTEWQKQTEPLLTLLDSTYQNFHVR